MTKDVFSTVQSLTGLSEMTGEHDHDASQNLVAGNGKLDTADTATVASRRSMGCGETRAEAWLKSHPQLRMDAKAIEAYVAFSKKLDNIAKLRSDS